MKVMVPITGALQAGLRTVMSSKEADAVIETMRARVCCQCIRSGRIQRPVRKKPFADIKV